MTASTPLPLLDLCCCGGLGADGYAAVGFAPHGVDKYLQPDYPYPFTQADALAVLRSTAPEAFAVLHASFPCQLFTRAKHLRTAQGGKSKETIDLLTPGLALLRERWGHKPWVVENVEDRDTSRIMAPLPGETLIRLCGSTFGLQVQRHRLFLSNVPLRQPVRPDGPESARRYGCAHDRFPLDPRSGKPRPWGVWHVKGDSVPAGGRTARDAEHGRQVMGSHRSLPWDTLKEGFPPAYTSHVGADLLVHLALRGVPLS